MDKDTIGKDKMYHLLVCLISAIVHPLLAIGLAIGKEYGDSKASGNHWCWWDLLADAIGTAIGSVIWWFMW